MHRYRYYRVSTGATVFWWAGTLFLLSGIGNVIGRNQPFGLATIVVGLLFFIFAEADAEKAMMRKWQQNLNEGKIRTSIFEAVEAYNKNPCERSLNHIRSLNSDAADYICQQLQKKKK